MTWLPRTITSVSARLLNELGQQYAAVIPEADAHLHDDRYYPKAEADSTFNFVGSGRPTSWNASTLDGLSLSQIRAKKFPVGIIVMTKAYTAPAGWAFCDGTNGIDDMRDYFIPCAGGPNNYTVGQIFGPVDNKVTPTGSISVGTHAITLAETCGHLHRHPDRIGANPITGQGGLNEHVVINEDWVNAPVGTPPNPVTSYACGIPGAEWGAGLPHGHPGSTITFQPMEKKPACYAIRFMKRIS